MKTSGRRLRSGKTLTNSINKSIRKSGVPTENGKRVVTRTARPTSTKSLSKNTEKSEDEEAKETVSSVKKDNTNARKNSRSSVTSNKKKVSTSDGMKLKKKTSVRQMSLKESFSNQETLSKRLRPRQVSRNYCENSVVQQSSTKLVDELNEDKSSKVPVYKSVKLHEESLRNGSDIYDFNFDANDSKERLVTKRRGRLINRVKQKKVKRATRAKVKLVQPIPEEKVSTNVPLVKVGKKDKDNKNLGSWTSTDIVKKSDGDNKKEGALIPSINVVKEVEIDTESVPDNMRSLTDPKDIGMQSDKAQGLESQPQLTEVIPENAEKQPSAIVKPKIVSIENLDKNKVLMDTPVKSNSKNYVPFRKTNIFKNKVTTQYGAVVNYSLINKSLSPIKKASENFDPGSPWRLSPLNTFSRVRTLFQSTPQPRQVEILQGRIKRNTKGQIKNLLETIKKNDVLETDNENINTHKTLDKSNYITRKFGQSVRKFGTEITNLDHSVQSTNNAIIPDQYEATSSNRELKLPDVDMPNRVNSVLNVSPTATFSDSVEDKENAAPKSLKTKKLLKKRSRKLNNKSFSPLQKEKGIQKNETLGSQLKTLNIRTPTTGLLHAQPKKVEQSKENVDPQPGPSGLQKNKSPSDKLLASPSWLHDQPEREQSKEYFEPQPGPSGLQNNKSLSSGKPLLSPVLLHDEPETEDLSKEYFDPQPGPSGLQKNKSPTNKVLQQTNLNAFLNIAEMPQSTRISTAHGIFNDAHSTPIYGKPPKLIKQVDTEKLDVNNAFGFEEDSGESNLDISPIYFDSEKSDMKSNTIEKTNILEPRKSAALPVRLLPRTTTKNVVQQNVDILKDNAKKVGMEDTEVEQTLPVETNQVINTINFTDTFDVLEEENKRTEESLVAPLFKDFEPIHFTQPPKRSYKRRRNVRFNFSESGSEDTEELDGDQPERKKKKYGKLNKVEVKRMKEWIKNINDTFEEIDKYELHVE